MSVPMLTFDALSKIPGLRHGFVSRVPGVDVKTTDRELAVKRLAPAHDQAVTDLGFQCEELALAEQVHGSDLALVGGAASLGEVCPGVDGLLAAEGAGCMGIYVADCCAVYLIDPVNRCSALVHSGRAGSEQGIAVRALEQMARHFSTRPEDVIVQLSPCIRPPNYEVDFAKLIIDGLQIAGVPAGSIHDSGVCTASDLDRFYSYRMEKGATGRMLALLGWEARSRPS